MQDVVEVLAAAGPHRGGSPNLALSVLLALLSACAFAVSTVVQHRAATVAGQDLPQGAVLRLVGKLVRNKAWIGGQAAALTGFCLHAAALKFGPVVVVQPLLSGGLVISLALGALVDRRHPERLLPEKGQWIAAGVVAVTLGLFVVSARPDHGGAFARPGPLLVCVGAAAAVMLLGALWALRPGAAHKALVLGLGAGFGFGITGLLLKDVVAHPPGELLTSWTTYLLLASGAASITFAQWAYQSGQLIECLPVMAILEPLVAVGLAAPVYGERLAPGVLATTGQVVGVLGLVAGVAVLARRTAARETTSVPLAVPAPAPAPPPA
ncbi:DMT family transporter [Klenkia sp. PcliD-1-E]|uniref:DMT family transporter n=1 Tax=Klenkia sp. PcliD-1-E TaxID=2954492 RepID=UPI0020981324|nr:DMT family transporter [Klenkia sp. PcliD-1-E]MCO7222417.1 DMT family transporter [Klenkia sp. PcliD-1-E]